jgi:hypothetical protein
MLGESQLNVYILGADLTPRIRERLQAQVQTALRSLPAWTFRLLKRRIDELGVPNLPLIVEPVSSDIASASSLGLGQIEGRPAARLMPRVAADRIQWLQEPRYLVAKAIAYMAAPRIESGGFWARWSQDIAADGLRGKAVQVNDEWAGETDLGLLVEMFAAYVVNPSHRRWETLPAIRTFLLDWR